MQSIVLDKPYRFVAPVEHGFWPWAIGTCLPRFLDRTQGVTEVEFLGVDRLQDSLRAGHGIMLTPNHCRPPDPMLLIQLGRRIGCPFYVMASWHLFMQGWFQRWVLRRMGVFSVYREGMDRESLKFAVGALARAARPLIVFPEGAISRTNDRLNHLMEGTTFIARSAARQRLQATSAGKVVIHPVAIRYFFEGDIQRALEPAVEDLERRLTWRPQSGMPLPDRIRRVGGALLMLKEVEAFGEVRGGTLRERLDGLIDSLLWPLEKEWLKGKRSGDVVARVKDLRAAILPDMIAGEIDESERARRWSHLADCYLAQQIFFYPPEYFGPGTTPEMLLETVERFEEDLTDAVRVYRPLRAVVQIGVPIEVGPVRDRGSATDPVMAQVREQLLAMLAELEPKRRRPPAPAVSREAS
jgi:1-acyl-sn-glycerol-3-phosphate acyltransferase